MLRLPLCLRADRLSFSWGENYVWLPTLCLYQGYRHVCTFSTILSISEIWKFRNFHFQEYFWFPWENYTLSLPEAFRVFCTPQLLKLPAFRGPASDLPIWLGAAPCACLVTRGWLSFCSGLWTSLKRGGIVLYTCLYSTWPIRYSVGDY